MTIMSGFILLTKTNSTIGIKNCKNILLVAKI